MPSGNTPTTCPFPSAFDVSLKRFVCVCELDAFAFAFGLGALALFGFRLTGIAPDEESIMPVTGFANIDDLAQKHRCRLCGIVTAKTLFVERDAKRAPVSYQV